MLECHQLEIVSASTNILSRQCWGPAKRYATPRVRERTANYLSHTVGQRAYRIKGRLELWTLPLSSVYLDTVIFHGIIISCSLYVGRH